MMTVRKPEVSLIFYFNFLYAGNDKSRFSGRTQERMESYPSVLLSAMTFTMKLFILFENNCHYFLQKIMLNGKYTRC